MAEPATPRSLDRAPELVLASTYERDIGASLLRVWENVYDWGHLPYLHSQAFHSIDRIDSGDWGWHARIGLGTNAAESIELELVTNREDRCYVSRTLAGAGAPSEIWTHLDPLADDRTAIRVEFWVAPLPADVLKNVGEGYVSLYTLLWDQDEEMMQTREAALARRKSGAHDATAACEEVRSLGSAEALRARLPWVFEFGGERFRLVESDGDWVAHGVQCPHLLGPLDEAPVVEGEIRCPWHDYAFDVRTGRSCDGRGLRLAKPPTIRVDPSTGDVVATSEDPLS